MNCVYVILKCICILLESDLKAYHVFCCKLDNIFIDPVSLYVLFITE